jgi:hypothetical protein
MNAINNNMNRDDVNKLNRLYESMGVPAPRGPKCKIKDIIKTLEYWVKFFDDEKAEEDKNAANDKEYTRLQLGQSDDWPSSHQILKDYLAYAKISMTQPKRRAMLFEMINKKLHEQLDFGSTGPHILINYIIPNFGEIDGSSWEKYRVYYPDGDVYTLDLYPIDWADMEYSSVYDELEKPERMGNVCTIGEIVENLESLVHQDDDEYFSDALELAKRAQVNAKDRDALVEYIESDPTYIIPNFGEVEGVYSTYIILFPDGDKRSVEI